MRKKITKKKRSRFPKDWGKLKGITVSSANIVPIFNNLRNVLKENRSYSDIHITKFETGAIRDTQEGKIDFIETISWTAFARYAKYMTGKKSKYGAGNFKKGIPIESYEKSLVRHIHKYMVNKYERGDEEKAEDHLAAIVFNVFGIMHEEEMQKLSTIL